MLKNPCEARASQGFHSHASLLHRRLLLAGTGHAGQLLHGRLNSRLHSRLHLRLLVCLLQLHLRLLDLLAHLAEHNKRLDRLGSGTQHLYHLLDRLLQLLERTLLLLLSLRTELLHLLQQLRSFILLLLRAHALA